MSIKNGSPGSKLSPKSPSILSVLRERVGAVRTFEHRLERAQAPVVVLLRREHVARELEQRDQLAPEEARVLEALGV